MQRVEESYKPIHLLFPFFFRGETLPPWRAGVGVLPSWEEADPPFFLTQSSELATLRSCHQRSFCWIWSVWTVQRMSYCTARPLKLALIHLISLL